MLNSAAEGKLKRSEIYWPEGSSREYGPFMVTLVECQMFADYTIRTMQLVVSLKISFTCGLESLQDLGWVKVEVRARYTMKADLGVVWIQSV